jgi:hypothetical protein
MEKLHENAPDSIWMLQAQGEAHEKSSIARGAEGFSDSDTRVVGRNPSCPQID